LKFGAVLVFFVLIHTAGIWGRYFADLPILCRVELVCLLINLPHEFFVSYCRFGLRDKRNDDAGPKKWGSGESNFVTGEMGGK